MDSLNRNLNLIRQQGTTEQLDETRLLVLELMNEANEKTSVQLSPEQNAGGNWLDWVDDLKHRLNEDQIKLLSEFLERSAKEISSRRERDITLI